jgi:hypothetical protein
VQTPGCKSLLALLALNNHVRKTTQTNKTLIFEMWTVPEGSSSCKFSM